MGPRKRCERKENVKMAHPAFKGFLTLAHEGKNVPKSDADDGQRYTLYLCTGAFASDADDSDGG